MDQLLENDTRATVQLTRQQDSIAFLAHIYPERLLLPENETIEGLFRILQSKGHYKERKWSQYHLITQSKGLNRENELAEFLNSVHAAIHHAYGVSCLWVFYFHC